MPASRNRRLADSSKKREGGNTFTNILLIGFTVAGLILTMHYELYRGDYDQFKLAFIVALAISGGELVLNIIVMCCSSCCKDNSANANKKNCGQACFTIILSIVYLVGCCVAFALLVVALVGSDGIENSEAFGCANGFGCANIMAICGK